MGFCPFVLFNRLVVCKKRQVDCSQTTGRLKKTTCRFSLVISVLVINH